MKPNFRYDVSRYESSKRQAFQECIEFILNHNYGQSVLHTDLAQILKYNIEDEKEKKKYKVMVNKIRNALIDKGYVLKSIAGVGYYILKPQHIAGHCFRTYVRSTQRILDKSLYVLEHIDNTELKDDRIEEYNNFKELNEKLVDSVEEMIDNSTYYSRKTYYDSLSN